VFSNEAALEHRLDAQQVRVLLPQLLLAGRLLWQVHTCALITVCHATVMVVELESSVCWLDGCLRQPGALEDQKEAQQVRCCHAAAAAGACAHPSWQTAGTVRFAVAAAWLLLQSRLSAAAAAAAVLAGCVWCVACLLSSTCCCRGSGA
jgi:hypothetical protein